jgi:uncharacterized protein YqgC (DUF456 family)
MPTAIVVLVAAMMLVGIVGAVVPGIPGTPLILAGAVVYAFATDWQPIGVGRLLVLAALVVVAEVSGYAAVALGAKRSGGSRWAVVGAIAGTIVGLGFAPLGLILGPLAGAIAGEALRTGRLRDSVRPGVGAALGVLAGAVMQIAIALVMVGLFVWWAAFAG